MKVGVLLLLLMFGCGGGANVAAARSARYDADRTAVYQAALDYCVAHFAKVGVSPDAASMATSWQEIKTVDPYEGGQGGRGHLATRSKKHHFIRFDVAVIGERPWQLQVVGHASELEPGGAMPIELTEKPPWLDERTDNFIVELHEAIQKSIKR